MLIPLVLTVGFVALILRILALVPPWLQPEGPRSFATVEEAERALGLRVTLPAYFPDYLVWPPARITGQHEPYPQLSISFLSREKGTEALWLVRAVPETREQLPHLIVPADIRETGPFVVGDLAGTRIVALGGGIIYYQFSWWQEDQYMVIATTYPEEELLSMVRSMDSQSSVSLSKGCDKKRGNVLVQQHCITHS